ncbi:MAG: membrane protein insertion efficiency factor YidD [Bdellovibrionales bacterium]
MEKKDHSSDLVVRFLRFLIWVYRHTLSRFLGQQCRYLPTCSVYSDEALRLHGAVRGSILTIKRLCRCHPWGGYGFDPVPKEYKKQD